MKIFDMSGIIGWHVTPQDIREFLTEAKGEPVRFDIASPGGFVMPGLVMFNLIRDYEGETEVRLMGLAASMASYIALAADKRTAHDNAVFMIHNVLGFAGGDHRELRATADIFDKLSNLLAREYSKVTGKTLDEVRGLMDDTTFLFGDEIVDNGFVHEIIQTDNAGDREEAVAVAQGQFDDSVAQMKTHEAAATDLTQAAAYLNTSAAPAATLTKKPNKQTTTEEAIKMTLDELLASSPEAKALYDARLAEARTKGGDAVQARITKCSAILESTVYPKAITALAVKVLKGDAEPAALEGAAAVIDAQIEDAATAEAAKAAADTGDTPADGPAAVTDDGAVNSEADLAAEIQRAKGGKV
jgi:ATP-dependent protease ClpP protease subunit